MMARLAVREEQAHPQWVPSPAFPPPLPRPRGLAACWLSSSSLGGPDVSHFGMLNTCPKGPVRLPVHLLWGREGRL